MVKPPFSATSLTSSALQNSSSIQWLVRLASCGSSEKISTKTICVSQLQPFSSLLHEPNPIVKRPRRPIHGFHWNNTALDLIAFISVVIVVFFLLSFFLLSLRIHSFFSANLVIAMKLPFFTLSSLLWAAGTVSAGKLSPTDTITWGGDNSRTGYQS